jgi:hypothetical protein
VGLPLWIRSLLWADRALDRFGELQATAVEELALALVPPAQRQACNDAIYARADVFRPGGAQFECGLSHWEERLLAHPAVPREGRVLLGGAGGGRELDALQQRGHRVTAFEPCASLAESGRALAHSGSRMLEGNYADLIRALDGAGPLASVRHDAPFALVLLGFGSLTHVFDEAERIALFRALARIAPGAPVIASFLPRRGSIGPRRRAMRAALRALGAPSSAPDGAFFLTRSGFGVSLGPEEVRRLADAGGYAIAESEFAGDGFALLVPRG